MSADEPIEELERVLATRVRSESPSAECLDDDTIAAVAEGALRPERRAEVLRHIASCARCRGAVASVGRALLDPAVAQEIAPRLRDRPRYRVLLPLAAAAVVLLLIWSPSGDNGVVHRGPPPPSATVPIPRSPVGTVAAVDELRWSPVAGANRYRVTLFDGEGRVLYEMEVTDTIAGLPDSVRLVPGQPYLWKADARTGFDRWMSSPLVEFSLAGAGRR